MAAVTSAVIFELRKIKSVTVSTFSPFICHEGMGLDATILVFWRLSFKPAFSLSSFIYVFICLPGVSESACQCRRYGFDHWVRKILWKRNCNPLQYSCLGSPMDEPGRVQSVGWQSWTWPNEWAHTHMCTHTHIQIYLFKDKMKKLWLGLINVLPQTQPAPESEALPTSFFFDDYLSSHGRRE